MTKRKTTKEFIDQAKHVHGSVYDYSNVIYTHAHKKVYICCKIHGTFYQTPNVHLKGSGCPSCVNNKRLRFSSFIHKARLIHNNKYDYSKVRYINNHTKIIITCPIHGDFEQRPMGHLNGYGCNECGIENRARRKTFTTKEFIIISSNKHNGFYDYTKTIYVHNRKEVIIICPKHGEFKQTPNIHMCGHGCPKCKSSIGQRKIARWLNDNNIEFEEEKRFTSCRCKLPLPFDFYLPKYNILIEYDGIHHFKPIKSFGGKARYKKVLKYDKLKSDWADTNRISLWRIRYDEDINTILTRNINEIT